MPSFAAAVAAAAKAELQRFGSAHETSASAAPLLREYWMQGAGTTAAAAAKHIADRTAWSAAFISFVVLKALAASGAGGRFPQSAGHWQYVGAAIRNDFNAVPKPAFLGFPATGAGSEPVRVGDIVGVPRTTALDDFEDALRFARQPRTKDQAYPSHFDIVVEVANGVAGVIGGNVSQTVKRKRVKLAQDGRLPLLPFKLNDAGEIVQAPFIALVRHVA